MKFNLGLPSCSKFVESDFSNNGIHLLLSIGKSLYVDRLFEKFQRKSPRAQHIRIRLIEPTVDIDSLIKSLSEELEDLREQDPVLLHIDTAGVSLQASISKDSLGQLWLYLKVSKR